MSETAKFLTPEQAARVDHISGQEYIKINASIKNTAPNSANWFGTDTMGRDIFCRVWIGARLSLIVALVCSTIQIVVGCAYGGAMAYFGGTVDSVMMRVIEVITSFPSLASSCSCGNPSMCRRPR